jgi:hypothetical protein
MDVNGLQIPSDLVALIEVGRWSSPRSLAGNMVDLGREKARRLSPEFDQLVLMPPPFFTIADDVAGGNKFWTRDLSNFGEIDYSKAVIIADFGLGSDSPVILYYDNGAEPTVMYLRWLINDGSTSHSWVTTHKSFKQFAMDVGLL